VRARKLLKTLWLARAGWREELLAIMARWKARRRSSQIVKILMRTPVRNIQTDVGIVSEGEEEEETLGHRERRAYPSRNWLSRIPWLTQTGVNGKKRPPVGRMCLIFLKGNADQDVGQRWW
jgi:hypothetical protein